MTRSEQILGLVDRFAAALNARDPDAALVLLTDDTIFESTSRHPTGPVIKAGRRYGQYWDTCWE